MLPERPSPDGGEYVPAVSTSEEDEAWPGWDNNTVSTFIFVVYKNYSVKNTEVDL